MYVEELFLLACSAEGELAETAFIEADRQASGVPRLPLVVLRAAAEAAGEVGDPNAPSWTSARRQQKARGACAPGRCWAVQ